MVIPPPALTAFCVVALICSNWFLPEMRFQFFGQISLSFLIVGFGIGIVLFSIRKFYQAETTVLPQEMDRSTALVTDGIFRVSRNPMYLGMAAIIAGVGLGLGTWFTFLVLAFFVFLITKFQIKPEEEALTKIFGEEFENYKNNVRRWI